jgi:hypothetical protein
MAIANANNRLIFCDIGTNGRISDGGVIENIQFYENLQEQLHLPPPRKATNSTEGLPYMFI